MAATGPGSGNVVGGTFMVVKTYGTRVDDMIVKNPLAMKIAFGENPKRVYHSKGKMPMTRMATAALLREIPLKAHAHRADDIFTAHRVAKESGLEVTLDHCTEGHLIAAELAKQGAKAIVGPSFGHRTKFELTNKTFATAGVLAKAGLQDRMGSLTPGKDADLSIYDGDPFEITGSAWMVLIDGKVVFNRQGDELRHRPSARPLVLF